MVAREVNQLLGRVFAQRHKDGRTDLEAVESALRAALHEAGAVALSELLQFVAPAADQRQSPCPCGHRAQYQEIRSKPVLTIVGPVRLSRPYYLCSRCHVGQLPVDVELDIENTEFSPGVRHLQALVGQQVLTSTCKSRTLRCSSSTIKCAGLGTMWTERTLPLSLLFLVKKLVNRRHGKEKSFVDFGEFDEPVFPVKCARRFIFRIDDNTCRRDLLAQFETAV